MSGKNDRIILAGMVAFGVAFIALVGATAGIGTFVYFSEPVASSTPSPAPTTDPTPTGHPSEAKSPFAMDRLVSDRSQRTYTLIIALADSSAPVDMKKVTAEIIAGNQTYPAWDYRHAEYSWNAGSDDDMILEQREVFTMIIFTPQAGLPLRTESPVKLVLLNDGVPVFSVLGVTAA
jgi:hypothetical protein